MVSHKALRALMRLLCALIDYLVLMLPVQLVLLYWIGADPLSADFLFRLLFAVYGVLLVEYNHGATLGKMVGRLKVVDKAGGIIAGRMAILAEGDAQDREDLIYLERLPLFHPDGTEISA